MGVNALRLIAGVIGGLAVGVWVDLVVGARLPDVDALLRVSRDAGFDVRAEETERSGCGGVRVHNKLLGGDGGTPIDEACGEVPLQSITIVPSKQLRPSTRGTRGTSPW